MKNLQVKKQINNKLKLYRYSKIGSLGLFSLNTTVVWFTNDYISNKLFGIPISLKQFIILNIFNISAVLLNYNICVTKYPVDDIKFLKIIKSELKKEINRFENTSEEDFEIEFAKEKKKYLENKVK